MFILLLHYLWSLLGYIANPLAFPKPLSPHEESELLQSFWEGSHDARDRLIEHNLRLVSHIGKKYRHTNVSSDDLLSIGSIGLIKGIDSYKKGNGTRLATYLSVCIENEILMYLRKQKNIKNDTSLDGTVGCDKDGKDFSYNDIIYDEENDVFEITSRKIDIENILRLVTRVLDERERDIIVMRYGLDNTKPMTQIEIAGKMGISRSYVSRIETAALKKLKGFQN